jgi:hypothetical protein
VTYLETADEIVRDIILEKSFACVVLAAPAPDVLAATIYFALVQDCCANTPHNDAEDEESNCECGVVDSDFLRSSVPASPVAIEDDHTHKKRYAGNDEKSDLWPDFAAWCPCW